MGNVGGLQIDGICQEVLIGNAIKVAVICLSKDHTVHILCTDNILQATEQGRLILRNILAKGNPSAAFSIGAILECHQTAVAAAGTVQVHRIVCLVSGVVTDCHNHFAAVGLCVTREVQRSGDCLALLRQGHIRVAVAHSLAGRAIQQDHSGDVVFILCRPVQGLAIGAEGEGAAAHQLGRRIVHSELIGEAGALAQIIPADRAIIVDVVVWRTQEAKADPSSLGNGLPGFGVHIIPVKAHTVVSGGVIPLTGVRIVEAGHHVVVKGLIVVDIVELARIRVGDPDLHIAGVADQSGEQGVKLPLALRPRAKGVALGVIMPVAFQAVGIAIGAIDVACVVQAPSVALGTPGHRVFHRSIDVAGALEGPVGIVQVRTRVEGGGVRPVAVPAQQRNGMGHIQSALCICHRPDVNIALYIEAIGVTQRLHMLHGLCRNPEFYGNLGAAPGGNGNLAILHSIARVCKLRAQGGHLVGAQVVGLALSLRRHRVSGEYRGVQGVSSVLPTQVVQAEREAPALLAVPQLCLHLAVGLTVHQDHGLGIHQILHIGQASALIPDGVRNTRALLNQRRRCGHQQRLDEIPGRQILVAGDFLHLGQEAGLPDILPSQSHQARHMGGCHGGTGHHLIAVGLLQSAVDRVDVPARSRDLRLDGERICGAPRGELAHRRVLDILTVVHMQPLRNLQGTGVQASLILLAHGENGLCILQGQAAAGNGCGGSLQRGAECAAHVVVNESSRSTGSLCILVLGGEVNPVAPGSQDHLASEVKPIKIFRRSSVNPLIGLGLARKQIGGVPQEDHVIGGAFPLFVQALPRPLHPVRHQPNGRLERISGGGGKEALIF